MKIILPIMLSLFMIACGKSVNSNAEDEDTVAEEETIIGTWLSECTNFGGTAYFKFSFDITDDLVTEEALIYDNDATCSDANKLSQTVILEIAYALNGNIMEVSSYPNMTVAYPAAYLPTSGTKFGIAFGDWVADVAEAVDPAHGESANFVAFWDANPDYELDGDTLTMSADVGGVISLEFTRQ